VKKCPFKSQPVRELSVVDYYPRMILHRSNYNGPQSESVVKKAKRKRMSLPDGSVELLPPELYSEKISISEAKFQYLKYFKKFCSEKAKHYFTTLPHEQKP
jgi:hypothetical protein